ncbi:hypothetical protein EUGRSUZ_H01713 [Eucalyptus grandis]|uniref:Uncharacterized protein n=2 Tax=Eucalyptus grandis TaxID=71139 RepID=A0ACC3JQH8_EUCGR|nr:hypothetical protein EUGRSUZ_H01713 [Eucalyptus grandis]
MPGASRDVLPILFCFAGFSTTASLRAATQYYSTSLSPVNLSYSSTSFIRRGRNLRKNSLCSFSRSEAGSTN